MNSILEFLSYLFWFIAILIPLIAIHEFGHLLMARLCKVNIPEYAIGLPFTKRLFYKKWKGIVWSFYPVLLGGFVRIHGDNDALDNAFEQAKTNPEDAKDQYLNDRLMEILTNQELQFFLEENNLEYSEKWKEYEQSKYIQGIKDEKEKDKLESFAKLDKQLRTLIAWEYDREIHSNETFFSKNWFQQTIIIAGGVLFNTVSALLFFWILFTFIVTPKTAYPLDDISKLRQNAEISYQSDYIVTRVIAESPAAKAGFKTGDELLSFAGTNIKDLQSYDQFRDLVQKNKNQEVPFTFRSKETGELQTKIVKLVEVDGQTRFGVGQFYYEIQYKAKDPWNGLIMAGDRIAFIFTQTFKILGQIVMIPFSEDKSAVNYVSGPVAISVVSSRVFNNFGLAGVLDILGSVSLSLAIFNILPIPALDGGRWVIITLNKIFGRRNRRLEAAAIGITFFLMLGLGIIVAIKDVYTAFTGGFNF